MQGSLDALNKLMITQTGISFEFVPKMVTGVTVIKIHVDEFTAKKRPVRNGAELV